MGLLDEMMEKDDREENMAELHERLPAIEEQLTQLTVATNENTQSLKQQEENTARLTELLTDSQQPEQRLLLSELVKAVETMSATLAGNSTVVLQNGTKLKQSDFEAFKLANAIQNELKKLTSAFKNQAEALAAQGKIEIDTTSLTAQAVAVLDVRLAKAVEGPVSRLEKQLETLETRAATVGAKQIQDAAAQVASVTETAAKTVKAIDNAEDRLDQLSKKVTWTAAGRMALAILPLAAVLLVVGGLTIGISHALGIGPIFGWAWDSFLQAETAMQKALIAFGAVAGAVGAGWLIFKGAKKLGDEYGRW